MHCSAEARNAIAAFLPAEIQLLEILGFLSIENQSPISSEAFQGLDIKHQQALTMLVAKMCLPQTLSAEEEKTLGQLIDDANLKQCEAEYAKGLKLIADGEPISLETFHSLKAEYQEKLAILVGRKSFLKTLPEKEQRQMKNLIELANLQQNVIPIVDLQSSQAVPTEIPPNTSSEQQGLTYRRLRFSFLSATPPVSTNASSRGPSSMVSRNM